MSSKRVHSASLGSSTPTAGVMPPAQGILRRGVAPSARSAMAYPNQQYRIPAHYDPGTMQQPYPNVLQGAPLPPYRPVQQSMQGPYYTNAGSPVEYHQPVVQEDLEEEEEELEEQQLDEDENDAVNEVREDPVTSNVNIESGVETVRNDQKQGKVITLSASAGNPVTYDPNMSYDINWQNAAYGSHINTGETYYNYVDPRSKVVNQNPYLEPRKNPYPYQSFETSKTRKPSSAENKHLYEAWAKYQNSLKKTSPPRSANPKEPSKPERTKKSVGDGSSTVEGMDHVLGEMEHNEMIRIKKDLRDFQNARRRLIYDATSIKPIFNYPSKS